MTTRKEQSKVMPFGLVLILSAVTACVNHTLTKADPSVSAERKESFLQSLDKDVDILFVVDKSGSMKANQEKVGQQFPRLIEALRSPKLGNKLPNVRIGIISTDLGISSSTTVKSCEKPGGDGGRLLFQPKGYAGDCPVLNEPWISYEDGVTNLSGGSPDPIEQVKFAFQCIASLGTEGCTFEHQLESARRALSGANSAFIRPDALLVVVFITDEDDCSVKDPRLFENIDLNHERPDFRCFKHGYTCDVADASAIGYRKNCVPSGDFLYPIEEYRQFFQGLKPPGRVLLAAIAGPANHIKVVNGGGNLELEPSCSNAQSSATPAIRIKALIDSFGENGQFTSICDHDFGPALQRLGDLIVTNLGRQCLRNVPLSFSGAPVCQKGDVLSVVETNPAPSLSRPAAPSTACVETTLHQAECLVEEKAQYGVDHAAAVPIDRCPAEKFLYPEDQSCGSTCPCWRLVAKDECSADGSPYGLEILRTEEDKKKMKPGTMATISCAIDV